METEALIVLFNGLCLGLLLVAIVYWIAMPIITSPYFASSSREIIEIFDLADLSEKDVAVDLGSGDGRVALAASRVCRRAVGIEINPFLTLVSRLMALLSANGEVEFKHKNFWHENLAPYDVIFMYLSPKQVNKLALKLAQELAPGSRVVSHSYKIKDWKAQQVVDNKYYLYVIGKHK